MADEAQLAPLRSRIERYYSAKVERYGATPMGVDWSCEPTQQLRFVQLLRLCDFGAPFSLDDLGCGYGAMIGFIHRRFKGADVDYLGIDLSPSMIEHARHVWRTMRHAEFCVGERSPRLADCCVASGIFNVRIDEPPALWERFIEHTLAGMAAGSRTGLAVNFLARLAPGVHGKPELYRCEPQRWIDFCERKLAMRVSVLDAYGMREFTLLARH